MTKTKIATLSCLFMLISGCAWVEVQPGAEQVRVIDQAAAAQCEHVANTTVSVRDRVIGVQRKPGKVQEELETLARNSAHETGANALLPLGPVLSGKREYAIYRC